MREFLFVIVVVLILLALTALRYRRQIASLIGIARMLKDAKSQMGASATLPQDRPGVQLVNCATCGVWIPGAKAINRTGSSYCSDKCAFERVT